MSDEVPAEGPLNAKIMLVGEAPGRKEERSGRPFVGAAGIVLDQHLEHVGISRKECYIDNVVHVRPAGNKFANLDAAVVKRGQEALKRTIKKIKPNVVVAMGNEPLEALQGVRNITKRRGSVYWNKELGVKVMAAFHPSHVQRAWENSPLFILDLQKARMEALSPKLKRRRRNMVLDPSFETVMKELKRFRTRKLICFDLETTYATDEPATALLIGIADSPEYGICIPLVAHGTDRWELEEEAAIIRALGALMADESVAKEAQNGQFDLAVLKNNFGIEVKNYSFDSMCAFHSCYPELPKSLDCIMSIYTDQPYYGYLSHLGEMEFREYNVLDAMVTFESCEGIREDLVDLDVHDFYHDFEHKLIFPLLDMQMRGIKIDIKHRDSTKVSLEERRIKAQETLNFLAWGEINANSSVQMGEFFYEQMGLKPYYTKKGAYRVDKQALKRIKAQGHGDLVGLVEYIRSVRKLVSTYIDAPLYKGRMHTSFNIGGRVKSEDEIESAPATGRLSSSRSIVFGSGTNFQNFPKGVCRRMFIPDIGMVWVMVDLRQAENRIVAYLAQEPMMIAAFEQGIDVHTLIASWIFDCDVCDVTPAQRYIAKRHVHALNYGEKFVNFSRLTGLTTWESKEVIRRYFDSFPKIKTWQENIVKKLGVDRTLVTVHGRKRIFGGRWDDKLFKAAYAYEPQSTIGDLLNKALLRLYDNGVELLLNVHDELDFQCPIGELDRYLELVKEAFNIPLTIKGRTFVIPIEIATSLENWNDLKEVA